ncbi:MAG: SRPBCC family protein [Candidatus Methylacidiphilales bacterium]
MKIAVKLSIGLLALVIILWLSSMALPQKWHVEKSISINATPSKIYNLTTELKNWSKWSPWYDLDPKAKWNFSDSTFGVGAWYTWKSEQSNVGSGRLEIISAVENQSNQYTLVFDGMDKSMGGFILTPEGDNATKVTWTLDGENKGMAKWFGVLMDFFIGSDYEKGLNNIKREAESK